MAAIGSRIWLTNSAGEESLLKFDGLLKGTLSSIKIYNLYEFIENDIYFPDIC